MKRKYLLMALASLLVTTSTFAQDDDDMYFYNKPKKQKVVRETVSTSSEPDYHTGDLRDVDEYNRRPGYVSKDTVLDSRQSSVRRNTVADSIYEAGYDDGYDEATYQFRLARYHGRRFYDAFYWDTYYTWYDPWFDPWYDPWYRTRWSFTWYGPGWYGPGWYRPGWYGPGWYRTYVVYYRPGIGHDPRGIGNGVGYRGIYSSRGLQRNGRLYSNSNGTNGGRNSLNRGIRQQNSDRLDGVNRNTLGNRSYQNNRSVTERTTTERPGRNYNNSNSTSTSRSSSFNPSRSSSMGTSRSGGMGGHTGSMGGFGGSSRGNMGGFGGARGMGRR